MDICERLKAFWNGEAPDQIPYTIYEHAWKNVKDDPAWPAMFEQGLGVTWHVRTFSATTKNVEIIDDTYRERGKQMRRLTRRTPIGELTETWEDGWHQKYPLETIQDYQVMTYIIENTELAPDYNHFYEMEQRIGPYGMPLAFTGRTPIQTILVDLAGPEQFAFHLFDFGDEVHALYLALLEKYRQTVKIVAEGPGDFVSVLENFTADALGPKRFGELVVPVYKECFPILQSSGKVVGTHYDGRLASCKELIADSPIDLIESLTEPPEGDLSMAEARAVWPDKLFWINIRLSDYDLAPAELRQHILDLVGEASVDGKLVAFQVSEDLPRNWRESLPVVLKTLQETKR